MDIHDYAKTIFLVVLFILSFVANTVLLIQQWRNRFDRSAVRYMLIHLALVNICCALLSMLFSAARTGIGYYWFSGDDMCDKIMYVLGLFYFLGPFSVEGLLMAYKDEQASRYDGRMTAWFFIRAIWACAFTLYFPWIILTALYYKCTTGDVPHIYANICVYISVLVTALHFWAVGTPSADTDGTNGSEQPDSNDDSHRLRRGLTTDSSNGGTTRLNNECEQEYKSGTGEIGKTVTYMLTTIPTSVISNIGSRSELPLLLNIVYFIIEIPASIIGMTSSMMDDDIVQWLYLLLQASTVVTGIIPVVWHMCKKRNLDVGV